MVWHLDVDSSHPGGVGAPKGSAVRRVKWYVSWVKYVVRQYGSYLLMELESDKNLPIVREDLGGLISGIPVIVSFLMGIELYGWKATLGQDNR